MLRRSSAWTIPILSLIHISADGTTVQLAFDVTEAYTVRQTQQRAYHTTFVILIAIGAAVAWLTSCLLYTSRCV